LVFLLTLVSVRLAPLLEQKTTACVHQVLGCLQCVLQAQAIAQNGEGTVKVAEVRDSQGSGDDQDKEPPVPVLPYMRCVQQSPIRSGWYRAACTSCNWLLEMVLERFNVSAAPWFETQTSAQRPHLIALQCHSASCQDKPPRWTALIEAFHLPFHSPQELHPSRPPPLGPWVPD
jgi:hypothetical protein